MHTVAYKQRKQTCRNVRAPANVPRLCRVIRPNMPRSKTHDEFHTPTNQKRDNEKGEAGRLTTKKLMQDLG
jgi:hypothetical protein